MRIPWGRQEPVGWAFPTQCARVGLCSLYTLHERIIPRHMVPTLPRVPQDCKNCTLQLMEEPGDWKTHYPRRLILSLNAVQPVLGPGWGRGTRAGGIYIFLYFQGNINRTLSLLYAIVNKYRPWRFKISCGFMKINKNEFLFFHQTQSSLKKYLTDTT